MTESWTDDEIEEAMNASGSELHFRLETKLLRERNAKLVAALDRIADSCCAKTGCGCRDVVNGYAKAAIAENEK